MFYPKCPRCGSATESAESNSFELGKRGLDYWLHSQAMAGHPHPVLKAAGLAMTIGRQIYKRVPGGGAKRCTNPDCRHEFN